MAFLDLVMESLRDDVDKGTIQTEFATFEAEAGTKNLKGLIDKNNELLTEAKKAKQDHRLLQEKYQIFEEQDLTPESVLTMRNELEALQSSTGSENIDERLKAQYEQGKKAKEDEIRPLLERKDTELNTSLETAKDYRSRYQDFRARSVLQKSMDTMNLDVDEFWFEGMFNRCNIEFGEEDKMSIGVFHDGGHVPLEDWMKIFPDTEQGKKYRRAPLNSGGGANGSEASHYSATMEDIQSGKFGLEGEALDKFLTDKGYTD